MNNNNNNNDMNNEVQKSLREISMVFQLMIDQILILHML